MLKTQREMKKWSMEQKKTEASFRCSSVNFLPLIMPPCSSSEERHPARSNNRTALHCLQFSMP